MKKNIHIHNKGFTLVEILVAVAVFAVVMTFSMGSILSIISANKKSQSLRSVMDNISLTLDSMTRTIRFGTNYHCGLSLPVTTPADCPGGSSRLTVTDLGGNQVAYFYLGSRIARTINGGSVAYLTSTDVTISRLKFFVSGSQPYVSGAGSCPGSNDCLQPKVIMVVAGSSGVKVSSQTFFSLETAISQRAFDLQ